MHFSALLASGKNEFGIHIMYTFRRIYRAKQGGKAIGRLGRQASALKHSIGPQKLEKASQGPPQQDSKISRQSFRGQCLHTLLSEQIQLTICAILGLMSLLRGQRLRSITNWCLSGAHSKTELLSHCFAHFLKLNMLLSRVRVFSKRISFVSTRTSQRRLSHPIQCEGSLALCDFFVKSEVLATA